MITIVDYGMGNIGSLQRMLDMLSIPTVSSNTPTGLLKAKALILPGVGSFDTGMQALRENRLEQVLTDAVIGNGTPVLGICLGMQLFMQSSEEGNEKGLGWIEGNVVRFSFEHKKNHLKIPHMGWNTVENAKDNPLIVEHKEKEARYYFAHSYHVDCQHENDVIATTHHGYSFPSVIGKGSILGVQFHPEKSHTFGMQLLQNFARSLSYAHI